MTHALVGQRIQVTERASLVSLPIRTLILSAQRLTLWSHLASLEAHLQIHSGTEWVGVVLLITIGRYLMNLVTPELPEPQKSHEQPKSYVHPPSKEGEFRWGK